MLKAYKCIGLPDTCEVTFMYYFTQMYYRYIDLFLSVDI